MANFHIHSPAHMEPCHWTLHHSIVSLYCVGTFQNGFNACFAYDLEESLYVPLKFYLNGNVALFRKTAFSECGEMLAYVDNLPEIKVLIAQAQVCTFSTTVDKHSVWVVELSDGWYATFCIEGQNVSLIGKKLASCGDALYRAERFIKEIQKKITGR